MGTPYSSQNKIRGYEPANCTLLRYCKERDAYRAAINYINENPRRNCCNVEVDNWVKRWRLPYDQWRVRLKKDGNSGTTFYYHDDLLGSDDF